ncbi:MAG: hypothetical protein WCB68_09660 [Pyrinomonadaceae bacterium]
MRHLLYRLLLKLRLPARAALAMTLALALLAAFVSFDALSSSKLCSMPCCAGKAPHLAGSCAGGHCHANLSIVKKEAEPEHQHATVDSPAPQQSAMHMHGAHEMAAAEDRHAHHSVEVEQTNSDGAREPSQDSQAQATNVDPEQTASIEPVILSRPCAPDCGVSTNGFAQLRRSRDPAALAINGQPRPPTLIKFYARSGSPAFRTSLLCRQCVPRGPPLVFS